MTLMDAEKGPGNANATGAAVVPSRVDAAYGEIRQRILDLRMPPGAVFLEADIAETLGMSRTPVREALGRLTHEGLIDVGTRRGVRIAPITARDVREINEVLAHLEIAAVESVASRALRPQEIAAFDAAIAAMDQALDAEDDAAWTAADFRFHRLLFDLSPNRHLRATACLYLDKAHRARLIAQPLRRRPVYSNANHAAVVEAIRRGDPEAARDIHGAHKRRWSRELNTLIEQFPDLFDAARE